MIDLLKNYQELQNASGYVGSLRYYLAKKKMDVRLASFRLFLLNGWPTIGEMWKKFSKRPKWESLKLLSIAFIIQGAQPSVFSS